jgi:hypothetical protein
MGEAFIVKQLVIDGSRRNSRGRNLKATAIIPDPQRIRRRLSRWYDDIRRPLPWRETRDPYAIWISEIMLQQTRVETVIPYYRRFLEKFPNVETLARAPLGDVLKTWENLGYYTIRRPGKLPRVSGDGSPNGRRRSSGCRGSGGTRRGRSSASRSAGPFPPSTAMSAA